jgi:hypothetical protein
MSTNRSIVYKKAYMLAIEFYKIIIVVYNCSFSRVIASPKGEAILKLGG